MISLPQKYSFSAIGTHWWLNIYDLDISDLDSIISDIEKMCLVFEQNYSRFLDTSLISQLNKAKNLVDFPSELFEMITLGEQARVKSLGAFNIGVGSILEQIGYDKNYSFIAKNENELSSINFNESAFEVLNHDEMVLRSNFKIDLGGLGKGFLIDKIAKELQIAGVKYFSINGGGDIYATSDHEEPLTFMLEHPQNQKMSIGQIKIKNLGLACSAPNRRQWKDKISGEINHHLIDLDNQNSKTGKLAVFTQAPCALEADITSTALFVGDKSKIKEITNNFNAEYLIIWEDFSYTKSLGHQGELHQN